MSLLLALALAYTICLGIEAFSPEPVSLRIAKIAKFIIALVFTFTLLT